MPIFRYFLWKIIACAIGALGGGLVVGALRLLVQVLYGHSFSASVGVATIFFGIAYMLIFVSSSVAAVFILRQKAKRVGVTFDYISKLSAEERKAFEKQHGF
jgi:predicted membrane channel-forming protein YqfA (hemolysin III family)